MSLGWNAKVYCTDRRHPSARTTDTHPRCRKSGQVALTDPDTIFGIIFLFMEPEAKQIITETCATALGLNDPYLHQLQCIYSVAFLKKNTLLVSKTASGKTECWYGCAIMLGGVVLVIMPLVALAAEQATRAQQLDYKSGAVFLKDVSAGAAKKLMGRLRSMNTKPHKPVILIACPQDLVNNKWSELVPLLIKNNLLSLVVIDEVHQVPLSVAYRDEFKVLSLSLFDLLQGTADTIPVVALTASFTGKLLKAYEEIARHTFDCTIWGDVVRDDVAFYAYTKFRGITMVQDLVNTYINEADAAAIIYTNDKSYADGDLLKRMMDLLDACNTPLSNKQQCAASLHGSLRPEVKGYLMDWFTGCFVDDEDLGDLRILTATSAANCGLNNKKLKLCIYMGFPECMCSLLQTLGRPGRVPLAQEDDGVLPLPYKYIIIMSIVHLVFLVTRIHRSTSSSTLMEDLFEVLKFLLLPTQCFQQHLREHFSQPKKRKSSSSSSSSSSSRTKVARPSRTTAGTHSKYDDSNDGSSGNGNNEEEGVEQQCPSCPFCTKQNWASPVNRQILKQCLNNEFLKSPTMKPSALVDLLWDCKERTDQIFPLNSQTKAIQRGDCEHLVMQLIAAKILQFNITQTDTNNISHIKVNIELGRTLHPGDVINDTSVNMVEEKFWTGIDVV